MSVCPSVIICARFSDCRCSYLERFAVVPCHVRTISASFLYSHLKTSVFGVHSLDLCHTCEVTLSLLDTLIDHVLLTYLLKLITYLSVSVLMRIFSVAEVTKVYSIVTVTKTMTAYSY